MTISSDQFTWLFINASCLAELALTNFALDKDSPRAPEVSLVQGEFDLNSVEEWIGDSNGEFDLTALLNAEAELLAKRENSIPLASDLSSEKNPRTVEDDTSGPASDIKSYLEWAYRDFDEVAEIANAAVYRKCHQNVEQLLRRIPGPHMQLCGRNTKSQMETWLKIYQSGDESLARLVAEMRKLQQ